jgi:hypothetical protein
LIFEFEFEFNDDDDESYDESSNDDANQSVVIDVLLLDGMPMPCSSSVSEALVSVVVVEDAVVSVIELIGARVMRYWKEDVIP